MHDELETELERDAVCKLFHSSALFFMDMLLHLVQVSILNLPHPYLRRTTCWRPYAFMGQDVINNNVGV